LPEVISRATVVFIDIFMTPPMCRAPQLTIYRAVASSGGRNTTETKNAAGRNHVNVLLCYIARASGDEPDQRHGISKPLVIALPLSDP
jgi:hypothetical protein